MARPRIPALPFIRGTISEGQSANASYRAYRAAAVEAGAVGMRRQDYLRLFSQTRRLRAQAVEASRAPKNIPGGGLTPVPRDVTRGHRGFGHWVQVFQRETGGSAFFSQAWVVKSESVLTPEQAEQQVMQWIDESDNTYNRTVVGVGFVGIERFNPVQR